MPDDNGDVKSAASNPDFMATKLKVEQSLVIVMSLPADVLYSCWQLFGTVHATNARASEKARIRDLVSEPGLGKFGSDPSLFRGSGMIPEPREFLPFPSFIPKPRDFFSRASAIELGTAAFPSLGF